MRIMKTYKIQSSRKLFLTGDEHYFHKLMLLFRPFETLDEMNETLISNSNKLVKNSDIVVHHGDFSLGSPEQTEEILKRLNGHHIVIPGDHDRVLEKLVGSNLFELRLPIFKMERDGQQIIGCHYNMRTWPRSHYNSWHTYAHSHGKLLPVGKSHDVGVDNNSFRPISSGRLSKIMREDRLDNENFIKPEDRRK